MKYSKEFKEEALKLSDEIGVKKAAQQLGIQYYTLSDWRSKRSAAIKHSGCLVVADISAILSNFVFICSSVPEYGICVLRKTVMMQSPFLCRHYPTSSVL